eukprot:jgi/Galph1/2433/GphlegSOOS_G1084.1
MERVTVSSRTCSECHSCSFINNYNILNVKYKKRRLFGGSGLSFWRVGFQRSPFSVFSGSLGFRKRQTVSHSGLRFQVLSSIGKFIDETLGRGDFRRWEKIEKSFILRPTLLRSNDTPRAVIHFIGGAFVSAIPHLAYKRFLESLQEEGHVVVTSPYNTSFDHLTAADSVSTNFNRVLEKLKMEYSVDLPVIGLAHSLGCIIQILSCSLFRHTVAGNIFLAYNNKPLEQAVPQYKEFFVPSLGAISNMLPRGETSWTESASAIQKRLESVIDSVVDVINSDVVRNELYPNWKDLQSVWRQVDQLLEEVQNGKEEFYPSPEDIENVILYKYKVQQNYLIRCLHDAIDESLQLCRLLRKNQHSFVKLRHVDGTHLTPLEQFNADNKSSMASVAANLSRTSNLSNLIHVTNNMIDDIIISRPMVP